MPVRKKNLCWLVSALALSVLAAPWAQARPYRGPVTWSIVLCKFSDSPAPPHDTAYYRDLIANRSTDGLSDFIAAVSSRNLTLLPPS